MRVNNKNVMNSRFRVAVLAIASYMVACPTVLADKPILPYDLGNLGYAAIGVEHISEAGDMVGWSTPLFGSGGFPFYWSRQTGMINLGSCCGGGDAHVITDDGVVIGEEQGPGYRRGFYWTPEEGRVNIPLVSGFWQIIREANPKNGMVIGDACDGSVTRCDNSRGFAWTKDGGLHDLGAGCFPFDVNDVGQVVGFCGNTAFIWTAQQGKQDINIEGYSNCYAEAINNAGQVVGNCRISPSVSGGPAFVWTASGGGITFDYPGAPSGVQTAALDINEAGRVVGTPAFTWTEASGIVPFELPGLYSASLRNLGNKWTGPEHGLSESGHVFLEIQTIDEFTGAVTPHVYVWHEKTGYEKLGSDLDRPTINGWNDHGVAVGYKSTPATRTYIWSPATGVRFADCLVVGQQCLGQEINNRGQVAGTARPGFQLPNNFALWNTGPRPSPVALGDLNGNGSPDLGVAMVPGGQVHVRDGSTDELISVVDFGAEAAVEMLTLPDMNASGNPEVAMLTVRDDDQVRVQVRDSVSGELVNSVWFGLQYEPVSMTVVADYNGNGAPEIAMLGSEADTDAVRVQLRDSSTGAFIDNVFLGTQSLASDVVSVGDNSGNGVPEISILGVLKSNEHVRSQLWDADTAAFQTNVWFGNKYQPQSMITMPDINSNGSDEIVVVGVDPATRQVRVQVRDSASTETHYNIWLGAVNRAVDVALINDINGNEVADLAVLLETPEGTGRVRVQDGLTGAFIRNLFFSAVEAPTGLAVMPDYSGNGFEELAVAGENSGVGHVQILDTSSGAQINRIDYP